MTGESRNWKLLLGSATLTFLVTLATFVSSVATVRAGENCWSDGMYGIGPNCIEECNGPGYPWGTCDNCSQHFCAELADPGYPYQFDWDCYDTCRDGAANSGCGEYCYGG
jgi:hypothetical protein